MRPLLVGELNPHGIDPRFALYPLPEGSTGHRLCTKVMGLARGAYLRAFDRANLCTGRWSMREARDRARLIDAERTAAPEVPIVLFGRKVCEAFGVWEEPFTIARRYRPAALGVLGDQRAGQVARTYVVLPHPSGRCRAWNDPSAFARARRVLADAGALQPRELP